MAGRGERREERGERREERGERKRRGEGDRGEKGRQRMRSRRAAHCSSVAGAARARGGSARQRPCDREASTMRIRQERTPIPATAIQLLRSCQRAAVGLCPSSTARMNHACVQTSETQTVQGQPWGYADCDARHCSAAALAGPAHPRPWPGAELLALEVDIAVDKRPRALGAWRQLERWQKQPRLRRVVHRHPVGVQKRVRLEGRRINKQPQF